ncbi:hypothetical protein B0T24DRAFT_683495 [Lasiosphaeria ovina]|uniref:Protein HGH1 N-terminal domain-containing protein n=1 Tax=Lasiosphaeria ovina TaxID=92902 RepID=A0AAE0JVP4_9PEZI|nr:hypothetical protein B0T24DRAFT_683495 [Lasiosphaeria ovina]
MHHGRPSSPSSSRTRRQTAQALESNCGPRAAASASISAIQSGMAQQMNPAQLAQRPGQPPQQQQQQQQQQQPNAQQLRPMCCCLRLGRNNSAPHRRLQGRNNMLLPSSGLSAGKVLILASLTSGAVGKFTTWSAFSWPEPSPDSSSESYTTESRRVSQFSNVSSNASTMRQLKTHIGPWQLGKTSGEALATASTAIVTARPAGPRLGQLGPALQDRAGQPGTAHGLKSIQGYLQSRVLLLTSIPELAEISEHVIERNDASTKLETLLLAGWPKGEKTDSRSGGRLATGVTKRLFANGQVLKTLRASKSLNSQAFKKNFWRLTSLILISIYDNLPRVENAATGILHASQERPNPLLERHETREAKGAGGYLTEYIAITQEPDLDIGRTERHEQIPRLSRMPTTPKATPSQVPTSDPAEPNANLLLSSTSLSRAWTAPTTNTNITDFDYLTYLFADIAKHSEIRYYFVTKQSYDDVIPLNKIKVFTEHTSLT